MKKIRYIVSSVVGLLMAFLIIMSKWPFGKTPVDVYKDLSDAFFAPGALIFSFGLLTIASNEHVFDMVSYGFRAMVNVFRKEENRTIPHSYIDYRLSKEERGKSSFLYLIITGLVFMIISAVFVLLFESVYIG